MATLYDLVYRLKTEIDPPFDISSLGHYISDYIGEEVLKKFLF